MKNTKDYLRSVKFSLSYAFRFVPGKTIVTAIVVVIAGILPYLTAYLLGSLVNIIIAGAKSGVYGHVWFILMLYAFVAAMPTILGNIRIYMNRHRWLPLQLEIDMDLLGHREKLDIARYEDPKFQDLIQRAFRQGQGPIFSLADGQFDVLSNIMSFLVGTTLAVHFNPLIYIVVIVAAIPSFIVDIKYSAKNWSIWAKDSPAQRRLSDLRQHITAKTFLIETKLLQSGKKLFDWMRKIMSDFNETQLALEKNRLWSTSATDLVAFAGFAAGLALLLHNVIAGSVMVGSLVYMMSTLSNVRSSIASFLTNVSNQYDSHLMVKDFREFREMQPIIVDSAHPTALHLTSAPEIVFENVSFKYPHTDKYSLRNISLTLRPGHKIGLVGNNGAGKTTFVKLLCRIYDPTEGRILVNGVDLRDVALEEWWSYLGVMFQDYASYDFVVKDAIAIGRPNKTTNLTKVVDAAHLSQAHTFIEEWKETYNEQLGVEFSGKEPSKGQRQKLSIAKILYRDAFLMILDEPTASVDAESEAKIFDSLEQLPQTNSALLISHDFSTILQCTHIFVLDKGELLEEGTHKELLKKKGLYAELYNLQAERFKK